MHLTNKDILKVASIPTYIYILINGHLVGGTFWLIIKI